MAQDEGLSRQIRRDYRKAALNAKDRAMLEYTEKLVRDRLSVGPDDHERLRMAGFSNADVLDITLVVANFMLANTLTDAFGLEYHENLHHVFVDETTPADPVGTIDGIETLLPGDEIWLNNPPTPVAPLHGRPLLVYAWDWTHPASRDGLPYLVAWYDRYARHGLGVLALLAPEFPFAKDPLAAQAAIRRLGLTLPVALVPSFRTWRGANNTFWPAWQIVGPDGAIRFRHNGPGGYHAVEREIQALVRVSGALIEPASALHRPGTRVFDPTPPLYAIYEKGRLGHPEAASADGRVVDFTEPDAKTPGMLYVHGQWLVRPDGLQLADSHGSVVVRYQGAGVTAVLGHRDGRATALVRLDGAPPGAAAGRDVLNDRLQIDRPGLFHIIGTPFGEHKVRLEGESPGFTVHAMTFLPGLASEPGPWPVTMVD